jgi:hypothetical protein
VEAAAPASAGVRCVQAYRFLGLLSAPVDGWCNITALYVARYGAPTPGKVAFIRTRQQIDVWNDVGKITSALAPLAQANREPLPRLKRRRSPIQFPPQTDL